MINRSLSGSWEFREKGNGSWQLGEIPGSLFKDLLEKDQIPDPFYQDNSDKIKELAEKTYEYRRTFIVDEKLAGCDKIFLSCQGLDTLAGIFLNGDLLAKTANMHRHYQFDISGYLKTGENTIRIEFYSSLQYIYCRQAEKPAFGGDHTVAGYPHLRKAHYMLGWDWGPVLPDLGIWRPIEIIGYNQARLAEVYSRQHHNLSENQVELEVIADVDIWSDDFDQNIADGKESSNLRLLVTLTAPDGQEWSQRIELSQSASSLNSGDEMDCNLPGRGDAEFLPDCCNDFWQKFMSSQKTTRVDTVQRKLRVKFHLENPQLWWPADYGSQPLYQLDVKLLHIGNNNGISVNNEKNVDYGESVNDGESKDIKSGYSEKELDSKQQRIGLRKIEVIQEPDEWGESFYFKINGKDIFIRGADYIPEDNLLSRISPEKSAGLIQDCLKANFNMIRVWGGGIYPSDYFYDICDEEGLLVWQDLMFACSGYHLTESFAASITGEIRDNVRRLRHHPSLAIWCGNNEIEGGMKEWGIEEKFPEHKIDYVKQFETLIPALITELDPDRVFWPSSPSSGGGYHEPNSQDKGNVHYWEVWHGLKPFSQYKNIYPRFITEFGLQSFPELKTVESFTESEDRNVFSQIMEHHQRNAGGNSRIIHYLGQYFKFPKDFASLLYLSQLIQAEGLKTGIEHFRRLRGRCMGSLYWQLNDCWPGASWSSRDYFGRWKALHYLARRFYSPILLSAEAVGIPSQNNPEREELGKIEAGNFNSKMGVSLHLTNDTLSLVQGEVSWYLETTSGKTLQKGQFNVEVPERTSQPAKTLDFSDYRDRKQEIYLRARFTSAEIKAEQLPQDSESQDAKTYEGSSFSAESLRTAKTARTARAAGTTVFHFFVRSKHFKLLSPGLSCRLLAADSDDRNLKLEITSENLAKYVNIEFIDESYRPLDNFFHLAGGEKREIMLERVERAENLAREEGAEIDNISDNIRLFSLYDSYEN